jgi:hypothetical protein
MGNKALNKNQTIVVHKQSGIDFLIDFLFCINLKTKDSNTITDCIKSLNKDFIELEEEVEKNEIKEIEEK